MSYASLVHAGNIADPEIGRFFQTMQEKINAVSTTLLFFALEINRLEDAEIEAKAADPALAHYRPWLRDIRAFRPHQLSRRHREAITREIRRRPRRLDAALRRDHRRSAISVPRPGTDRARGARPAVRARSRSPARGRPRHRRGVWQKRANLCIDHQHARQGQGDRGPLASVCAADLVAQSGKFCRGRGGRRADQGGADELPHALAPLLPAQGALVWGRGLDFWDRNAPLPEDEDRTIPWSEARETVLVGLPHLLARAGRGRRAFLRRTLDRRAGAPR